MKKTLLFLLAILSLFANDPPRNNYLTTGAWKMTHVEPYQQDVTGIEGTRGPSRDMNHWDYAFAPSSPITVSLEYSNAAKDNTRYLWAAQSDRIVKYDISGDAIYELYTYPLDKEHFLSQEQIKAMRDKFDTLEGEAFRNYAAEVASKIDLNRGLTGAYSMLDNVGDFYVASGSKILVFGDQKPRERYSPIVLRRTYEIPKERMDAKGEVIVGLNMTYNGYITFVTSRGLVGVVSRTFNDAHYVRLGRDVEVSNSMAVDEDGGIFVVTNKNLHRVQWTKHKILSLDPEDGAWMADYDTGAENVDGIRLGTGSGSTPTLMGNAAQQKLVVITDGADKMNMVFFWRKEIPSDWKQIEGAKDKRIAAQVPITFGLSGVQKFQSEQSLIVRGYSAVVVNNTLKENQGNFLVNALMSGDPKIAPHGMEKISWDPKSRVAYSAWTNSTISSPNAIPVLSSKAHAIYTSGQRDGIWTIEGIDWDTGESLFHYKLGNSVIFNACYSGMQLLPDTGDFVYGTFGGVMRVNVPRFRVTDRHGEVKFRYVWIEDERP